MKYKYLFLITNEKNKSIIHRYSRYKFGANKEIQWFSNRLLKLIEEDISPKRERFILANSPYVNIPPAIFPVCKNISKKLKVKFLNLKKIGGERVYLFDYASISDPNKRKKIIEQIKLVVPHRKNLKGKTIILIDDAITSGATVKYLKKLFLSKYGTSHVYIYSFIRVKSKDASLEQRVNSAIFEFGLKELIEILNKKDSFVNKHVVKSLFLMPEIDFLLILSKLSHNSRLKIARVAKILFPDKTQKYRIKMLTTSCA